jgi:hypothetical protein
MSNSQLREGFMNNDNYFSGQKQRYGRLDSSFKGDLNQVPVDLTQTIPHISYDKTISDIQYSGGLEKNIKQEREIFETKLKVRMKVGLIRVRFERPDSNVERRQRGTLPIAQLLGEGDGERTQWAQLPDDTNNG